MKPFIRLCGMNGPFQGRPWESTDLLRVGQRQRGDRARGCLRQPASCRDPLYRARLAGPRPGQHQWHAASTASASAPGSGPCTTTTSCSSATSAVRIEQTLDGAEAATGDARPRVQATANATWDEALRRLAFDSNHCPRPGDQLMALLRPAITWSTRERGGAAALDPQRCGQRPRRPARRDRAGRGAHGPLLLRALVTGQAARRAARPAHARACAFSAAPHAQRRVDPVPARRGRPRAGHRPEHRRGARWPRCCACCCGRRADASACCTWTAARGRSRSRMDDLHLADALAANVSAGIECAQLLRKQRDLFLDTITILAQAVELRDEYTGGHTYRVTTYSMLLAEQLRSAAGRHGADPHRHAAARHRQDRHRRRHPPQARPADAGGVRDHEDAHGQGGRDHRRPFPTCSRSSRSCARTTSAGTARATPTAWAARRSRPLARIVAVADAFDAMTSDRPYRKGMPRRGGLRRDREAGRRSSSTPPLRRPSWPSAARLSRPCRTQQSPRAS